MLEWRYLEDGAIQVGVAFDVDSLNKTETLPLWGVKLVNFVYRKSNLRPVIYGLWGVP